MIALTKNEIAQYLKDYAILSEQIRLHPDSNIYDLFRYMNFNQAEKDEKYFRVMIRVYEMIILMRLFSVIEDFAIEYLNNDELNLHDIFVNQDDIKYFSNKQIIKFIRNAFNHSENGKELYRISVNGRFIEIDLKNSKPRPFHVKLGFQELQLILQEMFSNKHNIFFTTFDEEDFSTDRPYLKTNLKKLELLRFYFPKKISNEVVEKIYGVDFSAYNTSERIDLIEKILKEHNIIYELKRFPIHDKQVLKLNETLKSFKKLGYRMVDDHKAKTYNHIRENFIKTIIDDTIPLGLVKEGQLYFELHFAAWFMSDLNLSYNNMADILNDIAFAKPYVNSDILHEDYQQFAKNRYEYLSDFYDVDRDKISYGCSIQLTNYAQDYKTRLLYPLINYVGYVLGNIIDDNEIVINNVTYDRNHIRNSIVHGRWIIGANETLVLFDCPNGFNNDYNFDWEATINLRSLLAYVENKNNRKNL